MKLVYVVTTSPSLPYDRSQDATIGGAIRRRTLRLRSLQTLPIGRTLAKSQQIVRSGVTVALVW